MTDDHSPLTPPLPQDFGLDVSDAPYEGLEMIRLGGVDLPKQLSPTLNWILGLSAAVPLALWSLWGLIHKIDSLVLGISIGLLAGIIVFQLAVAVVPLSIDVALYGLALLVDEIASHFSDKARNRIAYRKAWRAYRMELARGGYGKEA